MLLCFFDQILFLDFHFKLFSGVFINMRRS